VTGVVKWGQKSKPKKIPGASNKTPKNPWTKKKKKFYAKFPSLKNFQKGLHDITQKKTLDIECLCLFTFIIPAD